MPQPGPPPRSTLLARTHSAKPGGAAERGRHTITSLMTVWREWRRGLAEPLATQLTSHSVPEEGGDGHSGPSLLTIQAGLRATKSVGLRTSSICNHIQSTAYAFHNIADRTTGIPRVRAVRVGRTNTSRPVSSQRSGLAELRCFTAVKLSLCDRWRLRGKPLGYVALIHYCVQCGPTQTEAHGKNMFLNCLFLRTELNSQLVHKAGKP